jgi:glycerol uptake facilitator-like aquaporin
VAAAPAGIWKVLTAEFLFTFALASVGGISGGAFNPAVVVGGSITGFLQWGNLSIETQASLERFRPVLTDALAIRT